MKRDLAPPTKRQHGVLNLDYDSVYSLKPIAFLWMATFPLFAVVIIVSSLKTGSLLYLGLVVPCVNRTYYDADRELSLPCTANLDSSATFRVDMCSARSLDEKR
ncbi:hypothetical protein CRV24_007915 [Beauveria bassiana]|nr:hypothetical protein CRV24_007915 [Beauveria bassiana]KAH8715954.1 hypothetical protein HC256_004746 [Beauveria bassiana]